MFMRVNKPRITRIVFGLIVCLVAVSVTPAQRPVRDWVRDGVDL